MKQTKLKNRSYHIQQHPNQLKTNFEKLKQQKLKHFANPLYSDRSLQRYYSTSPRKKPLRQTAVSSFQKVDYHAYKEKSSPKLYSLFRKIESFAKKNSQNKKQVNKMFAQKSFVLAKGHKRTKTQPSYHQTNLSVRQGFKMELLKNATMENEDHPFSEISKKYVRFKKYFQSDLKEEQYGEQKDDSEFQILKKNQKLRKKVKLRKYQPPILMRQQLNKDILSESYTYMKKTIQK